MRSSLRQPGRAWVAHRDRTDAGHDLALGQMPAAHQALAAVIGVGMATAQGGYFDLDRSASSVVAQHAQFPEPVPSSAEDRPPPNLSSWSSRRGG